VVSGGTVDGGPKRRTERRQALGDGQLVSRNPGQEQDAAIRAGRWRVIHAFQIDTVARSESAPGYSRLVPLRCCFAVAWAGESIFFRWLWCLTGARVGTFTALAASA
jgi:hypothetical protein